MVALSEAFAFPFVVGRFEVPAATFRRFEELWQTLGLKTFANVPNSYMWSLIWSLHTRAYHSRSHEKMGAQLGTSMIDHFSTRTYTHHPQSNGGCTADLLRHTTTPHPESDDHRCRISGVQESEDPTTVRDPCVPTPHARNSRSQCA